MCNLIILVLNGVHNFETLHPTQLTSKSSGLNILVLSRFVVLVINTDNPCMSDLMPELAFFFWLQLISEHLDSAAEKV
jgi:hypothetical protein